MRLLKLFLNLKIREINVTDCISLASKIKISFSHSLHRLYSHSFDTTELIILLMKLICVCNYTIAIVLVLSLDCFALFHHPVFHLKVATAKLFVPIPIFVQFLLVVIFFGAR